MLSLFFKLLIGHAVADYALQNDFLARGKNHTEKSPLGTIWPWCLFAHSGIHAGAVWLITGSPIIAGIEFVLHSLIDHGKCAKCWNFHMDQFLHIFCKFLYCLLAFY